MLKVAWCSEYVLQLPEGHRFPMEKYELLPQQLLHEGTLKKDNFFAPEPALMPDILAVHSHAYLEKLQRLTLSKSEIRKTGFPLSTDLIEREILIAGGTVQCAHYALQYGVACNIAGGTHHAFTDHGEGFCLLNDQAIAAQYLLTSGLAKRVAIIDLDVHQGNGTAQVFAQNEDVFTFSMHGASNYPLRKEISDMDVGLADGTSDDIYLNTLREKIKLIEHNFNPDFVFFQAGVDVLSTDKLGRLGLTNQGCKERDRLVIDWCQKRGLPLVICMGGGYSPKIAQIIEAHANTYRIVNEIFDF
ncbi:MAG: acetoin utilization deacetylase AcuC-like enzyme [Cyclobacteriaceae bacterium]|jgi:acetoin utilization deacetylase AcuC-like enzyme